MTDPIAKAWQEFDESEEGKTMWLQPDVPNPCGPQRGQPASLGRLRAQQKQLKQDRSTTSEFIEQKCPKCGSTLLWTSGRPAECCDGLWNDTHGRRM